MKKISICILITAVIFFCIDRVAGIVLKSLYVNSNATEEYKISYTCESTRDSILFMGSSRCLHHFVPSIFEKEIGMTCFNAGDWGIKNIFFQYGLLSNILERYHPKAIMLEIHPTEWLDVPFSGIERAGSLAPYCGMSEGCDEMLKLGGNYWPYRISEIYRYTGCLPNLITGKYGSMDRNLKGWKPLEGKIDTTNVTAEEYPFPLDNNRVQLLHRFIDTCKERNIQLVFIVSPMYTCSEKDVFAYAHQLAKREGIPFLDYYRDPEFTQKADYFYDFGHMNIDGAKKFSYKVSHKLKDIIR